MGRPDGGAGRPAGVGVIVTGCGAPETILTPRLRGEPLGPEHEADVARLTLDPRVYRTLRPWPIAPTLADVRAGLVEKREHWERYGFGLWLMRDRESGEMVGRGGMQYTNAAGEQAVEVAWAIVPERWGQGLATELAQAAVAVGLDQLGLPELVAITLPANLASRRVMEKASFEYDREIEHVGVAHVLYRRGRC